MSTTRKTKSTVKPKSSLTREKPEGISDTPLSIRVAHELHLRFEALATAIARDPEQTTLSGGMNKSSVVRLCLVTGLRVLEKQYPTHKL